MKMRTLIIAAVAVLLGAFTLAPLAVATSDGSPQNGKGRSLGKNGRGGTWGANAKGGSGGKKGRGRKAA